MVSDLLFCIKVIFITAGIMSIVVIGEFVLSKRESHKAQQKMNEHIEYLKTKGNHPSNQIYRIDEFYDQDWENDVRNVDAEWRK